MTLPSRQDDGNVRSRAVCVVVQVVVGRVRWWLFYRHSCVSAPLLDRLPVETVSGDLAGSTRQLVSDTALLLLLLLLLCFRS